jgi:hypothetical protein
LALLATPGVAKAGEITENDLLARVIKAAGGRDLLARVKAIAWAGHAQVHTGEKTLLLDVKTRVEPFVRARSETALSGTAGTARTLIIEPDTGYVERDGTRTRLPPRQVEHERQQYAVYGYMLLVHARANVMNGQIVAERPGLPQIRFATKGDFLAAADYAVVSPEGDATLNERFLFEGELPDKGVHWPKTITILQNDRPYFILDLETFSVEFA